MSLRNPQREALSYLDAISEQADYKRNSKVEVEAIASERCEGSKKISVAKEFDFPSFCYHIATGIGGFYEEVRSIASVELLSGEVTLLIIFAQFLNECLVFLIIEEVLTAVLSACEAGFHLLAEGDKPVVFSIVTKGIAIGVNG